VTPVTVGWTELHDEALDIVETAANAGVTLRVVGSTGIRLHCPAAEALMLQVGRQAKDIDFVVPKKDRMGMRQCLEDRGYVVDRDLLVAMEGMRYSFVDPHAGIELDVFVESLQFNHTIEVRDRLDRHPVALSPDDLLLAKLQIVKATPTDLSDAAILLGTHPVTASGAGPEELDATYLAGVLAGDWGFHHTAVTNMAKIADATNDASDLGAETNRVILDRLDALATAIDSAPKSRRWRLRARVGERIQWWQDVDEREATY